jgi:hypothetical protein
MPTAHQSAGVCPPRDSRASHISLPAPVLRRDLVVLYRPRLQVSAGVRQAMARRVLLKVVMSGLQRHFSGCRGMLVAVLAQVVPVAPACAPDRREASVTPGSGGTSQEVDPCEVSLCIEDPPFGGSGGDVAMVDQECGPRAELGGSAGFSAGGAGSCGHQCDACSTAADCCASDPTSEGTPYCVESRCVYSVK